MYRIGERRGAEHDAAAQVAGPHNTIYYYMYDTSIVILRCYNDTYISLYIYIYIYICVYTCMYRYIHNIHTSIYIYMYNISLSLYIYI